MFNLSAFSSQRALIVFCLAFLSVALARTPAAKAYKPESPEVQQMLNRAVKFLVDKHQTDQSYYPRLGGMCVVGMAVYKHTDNPGHELVQAAVAKCKAVCRAGVPWSSESNYSVGIAVIFLCELDAQLYRPEIEVLVNALFKRQQSSGGWSYSDHKTGDTSQTQYGALGYWMAHRQGINVPIDKTERLCNWLIRTQTPKGNWGYQGKDPGNYNRVAQTEETMACAAAGLGSAYVCAELLGFVQPVDENKDPSIPAALRQVGEEKAKKGPITDKVDAGMLMRCLNDGDRFFATNPKMMIDDQYQHYYMYALERYMSFRELARHIKDPEPKWYDAGVDILRKSQAADGSWKSCEAGPVIDTSFAVLFLLRSAQKSIKRIVEESGVTRGGKYLPADLTKIAVTAKGEVADTKETPPIDVLMRELEEGGINELDASIPSQLKLSTDPQKRANELIRLRRMVMNGPYQARMTAVTTIGRDRNLDNVPVLIFALSDPDFRVVKAAQHGLRYISRRVDGFGLVVTDKRPPKPQYVAAQDKWKTWYRSIRPDGALIE